MVRPVFKKGFLCWHKYKLAGITLCLAILVLAPTPGFGGPDIADTLKKIQVSESNATKMRLYNSLFTYYEYSNADSGLYYVKEGLTFFSQVNYKPGIAAMLANMGGIYATQGLFQIARMCEDDALKIYTDEHDDQGIAAANNVLGTIDGRRASYADACTHFFKALHIYLQKKDTSGIADTYIKLGTANEKAGHFDTALALYNRGLNFYKGKPIDDVSIFLKNNIGVIYADMGDTGTAMKYYREALVESDSPKYAQIRMLPLVNAADCYLKNRDTDKAIKYNEEALLITEKEHLDQDRINILVTLADIFDSKDKDKSLRLLTQALALAQFYGQQNQQVDILRKFIVFYRKKGDNKTALLYADKCNNLYESLLSSERVIANANLDAKYGLDQVSAKLQTEDFSAHEERVRKNFITNIVVILAIFINLILFVVIYYYQKTKKLNEELIRRSASLETAIGVKDKLISVIAHDLLGTMGFMPLTLSLCKNKLLPVDDRFELLSQAERSAVASYETLQNMLAWGKSQMMGVSLSQKRFNAHEAIAEVTQFIRIMALHKHIEILDEVGDDVFVWADPNHFDFVIRNLLINAVKFTRKNGQIKLSLDAETQPGYLIFTVADNGIGIEASRLARIFEGDLPGTTGTDNEISNGIGLKLCREFIEANGGKIWVESELGKGSSFFFTVRKP